MTRFVGEAVGHRKAHGDGAAYKSRVEKMKKFLEVTSAEHGCTFRCLSINAPMPLDREARGHREGAVAEGDIKTTGAA